MAVAPAVVSMVVPSFPLQVSWLWLKLQGLFFACKVPRRPVPPRARPYILLRLALRERLAKNQRGQTPGSKLQAGGCGEGLMLCAEHASAGLAMLMLHMLMGWPLTVCSLSWAFFAFFDDCALRLSSILACCQCSHSAIFHVAKRRDSWK